MGRKKKPKLEQNYHIYDQREDFTPWLVASNLAKVINKDGLSDDLFRDTVLRALAMLTSEALLLDGISCLDDLKVCAADYVHILSKYIIDCAKANSPNIFGDEITNETCE